MNVKLSTQFYEKLIKTPPEKIPDQTSGIYVLYIDHKDFENKILPFYIGKSKNIKARFSAHRYEIKKLFDLYNKDEHHLEFNLHFDTGKQSGRHTYSKFFFYLLTYNLSIADLKIKIIELCENEEKLIEREEYYINYYRPDLFGFNQYFFTVHFHHILNATIKLNYPLEPRAIEKLLKAGLTIFNQYDRSWLNYGYAGFNLVNLMGFSSFIIQWIKQKSNSLVNQYNQETFNEFVKKFKLFEVILQNAEFKNTLKPK